MKIKFAEVFSEKDWIHKELMCSLNEEIINKAKEDSFFEVKLLVNGVELEPEWFNYIMSEIEQHIDQRARKIAFEKFSDAQEKINSIIRILGIAEESLKCELGVNPDE